MQSPRIFNFSFTAASGFLATISTHTRLRRESRFTGHNVCNSYTPSPYQKGSNRQYEKCKKMRSTTPFFWSGVSRLETGGMEYFAVRTIHHTRICWARGSPLGQLWAISEALVERGKTCLSVSNRAEHDKIVVQATEVLDAFRLFPLSLPILGVNTASRRTGSL